MEILLLDSLEESGKAIPSRKVHGRRKGYHDERDILRMLEKREFPGWKTGREILWPYPLLGKCPLKDRPRPYSKNVKTSKTRFERIGIRIGKGFQQRRTGFWGGVRIISQGEKKETSRSESRWFCTDTAGI
jgi:hypothetical protein